MRVEKIHLHAKPPPGDPVPRLNARARPAGARVVSGPLKIALIEPRYEPSFYGLDYLLPLLPGKPRAAVASGALPLLAAFVQAPHEVTLLCENVEAVDFERLKAFDIVGVTGMIVQRRRMLEILRALADHPGIIAVGGPYASVDESFFDGLCDVLFAGEADTTWPSFLASVARDGSFESRYEQAERTDLRTLPMPRYDLLDASEYLRIWRCYRRSGVPGIGLIQFVNYAAVHWHCHRYYKHARDDGRQIYNTYAYSRQPAASAPDAPV